MTEPEPRVVPNFNLERLEVWLFPLGAALFGIVSRPPIPRDTLAPGGLVKTAGVHSSLFVTGAP